jgi:hypothetical protein
MAAGLSVPAKTRDALNRLLAGTDSPAGATFAAIAAEHGMASNEYLMEVLGAIAAERGVSVEQAFEDVRNEVKR